jgi:hypothetical protein
MRWTTAVQLILTVTSRGRTLSVAVTEVQRQWAIAAVELPFDGPSDDPDRSVKENINRVFDAHAHQALDPEPTLAAAMAKAEKYARWWQRSGAVHAGCDCSEIEEPARDPAPAGT